MENVQETQEQVVMTKEQFDKLMGRIEQLEQANKRPDTPPVFSGGNMGLSVPYNPPAPKKSGWETVGKMAVGACITGLAWAICSAVGGNSGGTNTFGGSMPD
jgi:hypothetical protein